MLSMTKQTLLQNDKEFGAIYSNSKRSDGRLWYFNVLHNHENIEVFMSGSESHLNPIYKQYLIDFLNNYNIFLSELKSELIDYIKEVKEAEVFLNNSFSINTISIWNSEFDVVLKSQCNNYNLNITMESLSISDIYLESIK